MLNKFILVLTINVARNSWYEVYYLLTIIIIFLLNLEFTLLKHLCTRPKVSLETI